MTVSYPRAYATFSTSVDRDEVDTGIIPSRVTVTRRTHSQADTCEVEVLGSALPFSPEAIRGVVVRVFMADGKDATGAGQPVERQVIEPRFLRFIGFADQLTESRDAKGPVVKLAARDFSAMLRDWKPVPAAALPRYTDSLLVGIQRVLDACPTNHNADGSPRLTLSKDGPDPPLSAATDRRGATGAIHVKPDMTGWQVIEQAAGLVSTLVTVDGEKVTTHDAAGSYGLPADSAVSFVFGGDEGNLLSVERNRKFTRNRKAITLTSYSPGPPRQTLVAQFPSDRDALDLGLPSQRGVVEREPLAPANGITTQDALLALAKRVWYEKSRFEMEGKVVCPAWSNDVLSLKWEDRVTLRVDPALESRLLNTSSDAVAIDMLARQLNLERDAAEVLVRATKNRRLAQFLVRSVTHEFDASGVSSSTVEFINLIDSGASI